MRKHLLMALIASAVFAASATATASSPTLTLRGSSLSWTAVQGASSYQVQAVAAGEKNFTYVTGRSYAIPGPLTVTTKYRVREYTPEAGSWSNRITIRVAQSEKSKNEKKSKKEQREEEEEAEVPTEGEGEAERGPIHFSPGINAGADGTYDVPGVASLGAKLVRIDVGFQHVNESAVAQEAAQYVAKGVTPLILYDFHGTMPTATQVQGIAALARIPGVKAVEFGNETSYGYQYGDGASSSSYKERARTYAHRFVEAAKALMPYHIGLLAQASDGGSGNPAWVNEMFAAEPNLLSYVSGWTIHPYGTNGSAEMSRMISDLAQHGDTTLPIDITEWGIASDNGRALSENYGFPVNLTYAKAGTLLSEWAAKYRTQCDGRLRDFVVYQVRDQQKPGASKSREAYFGALEHEDQRKAGYTEAVETLMKQG
ncbi:MAG TPA: hypothetical protein VG188_13955 [Solirubrobacteraceae bacterium]|nr:hypothetical protein [Solirubrobacteraceae bacterium]